MFVLIRYADGRFGVPLVELDSAKSVKAAREAVEDRR